MDGRSTRHQLAPGVEEEQEVAKKQVTKGFQGLLDQSDDALGIPRKRKREQDTDDGEDSDSGEEEEDADLPNETETRVEEFQGAETFTTVTVTGLEGLGGDDGTPEEGDQEGEEEGENNADKKQHSTGEEDALPEVSFPFRALANIEGGKELMKQFSGNRDNKGKPKFKKKAHWNRKKAIRARKQRKRERKIK